LSCNAALVANLVQDLLRAEGMAQAFEGYQDATLPMDVSAVEA